MRFELSHRFKGARLDEVEALYMLDDTFNAATFERLHYRRLVLTKRIDGSLLVRTLRICSGAEVPAPFRAFVPASTFYFDEHTTYDLARHEGVFRTVPSLLERQFRSEGIIELEEDRGGVTFRLAGETKVSLPFIGHRAAKYAVETATRTHAALAEAVRGRLAAGRGTTSVQAVGAAS